MSVELTRQPSAVLTKEALEALLRWLDNDRDRAAVQYQSLHQRLTKFFQWRGCRSPHEHADLTLDRVARKILAGEHVRTSEKYLYVHGVALNILREYLKASSRARIEPLDEEVTPAIVEDDEFQNRIERQEQCVYMLPDDERELILQYYGNEGPARRHQRKLLARQHGMSENSLRIRIHRIREKLKQCLQKNPGESPLS